MNKKEFNFFFEKTLKFCKNMLHFSPKKFNLLVWLYLTEFGVSFSKETYTFSKIRPNMGFCKRKIIIRVYRNKKIYNRLSVILCAESDLTDMHLLLFLGKPRCKENILIFNELFFF